MFRHLLTPHVLSVPVVLDGDALDTVTSRDTAAAAHNVVLQNASALLLFVHRTVCRIGMSRGSQPQNFTRTDQVNNSGHTRYPSSKMRDNSDRVLMI
jgi:hypothetical protein